MVRQDFQGRKKAGKKEGESEESPEKQRGIRRCKMEERQCHMPECRLKEIG